MEANQSGVGSLCLFWKWISCLLGIMNYKWVNWDRKNRTWTIVWPFLLEVCWYLSYFFLFSDSCPLCFFRYLFHYKTTCNSGFFLKRHNRCLKWFNTKWMLHLYFFFKLCKIWPNLCQCSLSVMPVCKWTCSKQVLNHLLQGTETS